MKRKQQILEEGGQQALSHSDDDVLRIRKALERLRSGAYGACVDCGKDIDKERLEIIPESERCATCQTIFEEKRH